jgi:hypothetical protein
MRHGIEDLQAGTPHAMVHSPDLGYLDPPRREQPGDPGRGSWGYPSLASSRRM